MPWTALETAVPFCIVILIAILITRAVYNKPDLTPEDVRVQIEAARRERNQAIASVVSAHQERDAARAELRESEAGRRTLAKDLSACRDNVAALQQQLDDCQTTVFDAKTAIADKDRLANDYTARIVALEAECNKLRSELKEERRMALMPGQKEAEFVETLKARDEELERAYAENERLSKFYSNTEDELAKLQEAYVACRKELEITRGGFVQNR